MRREEGSGGTSGEWRGACEWSVRDVDSWLGGFWVVVVGVGGSEGVVWVGGVVRRGGGGVGRWGGRTERGGDRGEGGRG